MTRQRHPPQLLASRMPLVLELLVRDGGEADVCPWCEEPMTIPHGPARRRPTDRTIDHIVPLADGGTDRLGNLVLVCRACNTSRGTKCPTPESNS